MFHCKVISALDKVFADGCYDDYSTIKKVTALKGERVAFQIVCLIDYAPDSGFGRKFTVSIDGEAAKYTTVRQVRHVPALFTKRSIIDEDFIKLTPGLVPDVLTPLEYDGCPVLMPDCPLALRFDVEIPEDCDLPEGSTLTVHFNSIPREGSNLPVFDGECSVELEVIDAVLPEQKLLFTQWFHSDCLANYYRVEKWSDEHFEICERFARTAKKNGFKMILTPLISPPLDNAYDTRDLQLAIITATPEGYAFDWSRLGRWIDMCDRVGIELFEIGHLFTQGGATCATKVSGYVDGEYTRLFEKDTPCDDPEYTKFLRAMLTSFLDYMKARGDDKRCYFHISDEPPLEHLETYTRAKSSIGDLLEDYVIMDALSHHEFYESGAVKKPIVLLNHLDNFISHGVKELWTYNCCAPDHGYSNRFLGMSLARNRSICLLLYKYHIEGFLHWGYNFYNNSGSCNAINPFLDTSSGGYFPAGDAFSVYPGDDCTPLESLRLVSFTEALQDLRAMQLCEHLYSETEVVSALENALGKEIMTNTYVNDSAAYTAIRDVINSMIKAKISK